MKITLFNALITLAVGFAGIALMINIHTNWQLKYQTLLKHTIAFEAKIKVLEAHICTNVTYTITNDYVR